MIGKCAPFRNTAALVQSAIFEGAGFSKTWDLDCALHCKYKATIAHLWGTGSGWGKSVSITEKFSARAPLKPGRWPGYLSPWQERL